MSFLSINSFPSRLAMPGRGMALEGLQVMSPGGVPGSSGGKRQMTWADIESKYVGNFIVGGAGINGSGENETAEFSRARFCLLNNGNIICEGHTYGGLQAEFQLPATLDGSYVTRVGSWFDYTNDIDPGNAPNGWELAGMIEIGSRLHFTKHEWYNGGGTDHISQGYREGGTTYGMWKVSGSGAHSQRCGGYMSEPPPEIASLGYLYLAGQQGQSGVATGRWGPNLFAIDFDPAVAVNGSFSSLPLMYHNEANQYANWWIGDRVSSMIYIETPEYKGVLCLLYQQQGDVTWYGLYDDGPGGAVNPYAYDNGFQAAGFRLKAWIFDINDMLEVAAGTRDPWSVTPVEEKLLISRDIGTGSETHYTDIFTGRADSIMYMSYKNGRLIMMRMNGAPSSSPRGFVFDLLD
jgi:hypothetical protein